MKMLLIISTALLLVSCEKDNQTSNEIKTVQVEKIVNENFITEYTNGRVEYNQVASREITKVIKKMDFSNINLDFEYSLNNKYTAMYSIMDRTISCEMIVTEDEHLFHNKITNKTYLLVRSIPKTAENQDEKCKTLEDTSVELSEYHSPTKENFKNNFLSAFLHRFGLNQKSVTDDPIFENVEFKIFNNGFEAINNKGEVLRSNFVSKPISIVQIFDKDFSDYEKLNTNSFKDYVVTSFCSYNIEYSGYYTYFITNSFDYNDQEKIKCATYEELQQKKLVKEYY